MKRFLTLVLAMAMTLSLAACGGSNSATDEGKTPEQSTDSSNTSASETNSSIDPSALYAIGGGATGGTFNAMGATFTQFFNDGKVYGQFSATATTGGVQNIMFMQNGTCDFGIIGLSVLVDAIYGTNAFDGKPYEDVKVIAPLYNAYFQQFCTKDIKTEADLRGKKLVVGGPGSGDEATAKQIYTLMGMSFDDFDPQYLGSNEGIEAMKDGHADGAIAVTQLPFSSFLELTNAEKAYLMPLSQETIDKACEPGEHSIPVWFRATIPANTYKTQPEDIATIAQGSYLCCRGDLSDELVYELTKYIWENVGDLNMLHAALANLTIDDVKDCADLPIHPGALKYYQEQGIL